MLHPEHEDVHVGEQHEHGVREHVLRVDVDDVLSCALAHGLGDLQTVRVHEAEGFNGYA